MTHLAAMLSLALLGNADPPPAPAPPPASGIATLSSSRAIAAAAIAAPQSRPEPPVVAGSGGGAGGGSSNAMATIGLDAALAELDRQNLSIVQAQQRAEEAEGVAAQVRSALVPSLSAQASYTRNSDAASIPIGALFQRLGLPPPTPSTVTIQPLEQLSAGGSLRVPLVVPNAWYDLAAARDGARAAGASAETVRAQVRTGFAQAAFAAAAAEEVVVASERAVENAAAHARSAERRVAAGTAAPLDVLRAKTELVRRESDLARARADLDRARLGLGILLGREAPVRVAVPEPPPPSAEESAADASALAGPALSRRPEVKAQEAQTAAARASVRSTWARLAPQIAATGSAFASDVAFPTGKREGWRATVDLTWPLFDGGLREGRRREAEARLAGARAAGEAQRLAVVQEVSDGTREVAVAGERLRLAGTQRQLASDAAASARRSFEAGVASTLDVLDANDRLYQADVGLADARARLAQARVALDRALGR